MTIDMTKTYRTRDGRDVVLFSDKGDGNYSILGAIIDQDGKHSSQSWTHDGEWDVCSDYNGQGKSNLIEVKPRIKRTFWVNIYPEAFGAGAFSHLSEASARANCGDNIIARVKVEIDCEEGEGLEATP